jgi:3-isopropylmalate/(R)-2-methylmalate dehydratase small subunit
MEKFTRHTGTAVPLRHSNVDTDQIIPSEYLKRITRTGFEDGLFEQWRRDPDFVLNQREYHGASVLVAGPDFGTGSSREHAVWALLDYGFRVVISPRFGDIFAANSAKAGLLAVVMSGRDVDELQRNVEAAPGMAVTVDLEAKTVTAGKLALAFEIDDHTRGRMLGGRDDIALTLAQDPAITTFEANRPGFACSTRARA